MRSVSPESALLVMVGVQVILRATGRWLAEILIYSKEEG